MPNTDDDQGILRLIQPITQNIRTISERDRQLAIPGTFPHDNTDVGIFLKSKQRVIDRQHRLARSRLIPSRQKAVKSINIMIGLWQETNPHKEPAFGLA